MLSQKNVAEYLDEHEIRRARHPAIVEGDKVLSYAELAPLVRRVAGHLHDLGVREDEIVGVCLRDSADHLIAMFALARLGAAILPLDWRWTQSEKQRVALYFGVHKCLIEPGQELSGMANLPVDQTWNEAVSSADQHVSCASGGDRPIVLSLSSGTTGRPKGPMMSQAQFVNRLIIQWVTLGFSQHDRYLSATPLYFGGGRSFSMGSLFSGGTVIMFPPPYQPAALVEAVRKLKPTTTLLVPTLLRRLLELPAGEGPLLGSLNRLLSTGATLHPDERRAVMERLHPNFVNYYGSTEGGGITVLLPEHGGAAEASVGEPVFATKVQVVDNKGVPVATGDAGLVRYRGPSVADGFFNDPQASAEAFLDGWFYPGDIGRFDHDGRLYLVGRAKDVIIRAGINIYPGEIEEVLLAHPNVRDAAVVGWASGPNGEEVTAFVVVTAPTGEELLRNFCRQSLAPYKVPLRIFTIDELPKSPLGKVVKADLVGRLQNQ